MRRTHVLVLALVVALVTTACSQDAVRDLVDPSPVPDAPAEDTGAADDGQATDDAGGDQTGDGQADGGQADGEGSDGDGGSDQDAAGEQDDQDGQGGQDDQDGGDEGQAEGSNLTPVADDALVGANAAAYLRGDRPRVVLEVDLQEGADYPESVISHVRDVLARESNASVEVRTGAATGTRRDAWTADQLRAAADETRSVAHSDEVAVLHLLVLRDRYEDDGVLGLAFGSSSAVVFPDQWSDLTTALLSGDRIARAVSTHEVGHLLGLVGLYEPPTSDHEDPDHPGHTTDRDDVMYYAVERDVISQLDGIPVDFGELTRADLAAIREG